MDLQRNLKMLKYIYGTAKVLQALFQILYVLYLFGSEDNDTSMFSSIGTFILGGIFLTYFILARKFEDIFMENGSYVNYYLILLDATNFVTAVTAYPTAIHKVRAKYENKAILYYAHHTENTLGLKANEINRYRRDLNETNEVFINETIKEQIKNFTNDLADKAIFIFDDLLSFVSMKFNSSEVINNNMEENISEIVSTSPNSLEANFSDIANASSNEYNEIMNGTFHEFSNEVYEDFYFKHITSRLIIPSIVCLVIQGVVVLFLGCAECIKYRIRKEAAAQPPGIQMVLMGGEDAH